MWGTIAGHSNYLVATIYWWANYIKRKKKKKKKRKNKSIYANRITTLLYFTFEKVLVVFYCANIYWNSYTNKNNYSCLLDDSLYSSCIWKYKDKACLLWWLFDLLSCYLYNIILSLCDVWCCVLYSILHIWRYESVN